MTSQSVHLQVNFVFLLSPWAAAAADGAVAVGGGDGGAAASVAAVELLVPFVVAEVVATVVGAVMFSAAAAVVVAVAAAAAVEVVVAAVAVAAAAAFVDANVIVFAVAAEVGHKLIAVVVDDAVVSVPVAAEQEDASCVILTCTDLHYWLCYVHVSWNECAGYWCFQLECPGLVLRCLPAAVLPHTVMAPHWKQQHQGHPSPPTTLLVLKASLEWDGKGQEVQSDCR